MVIDMQRKFLLMPLTASLLLAGVGAAQQKRSLPQIDAAGLSKAVAGKKGKVVLVNFWATWCAPCVAEFPDIVRLYQKYHVKGLEVIAVSFDEKAPMAILFLDKQKAEFLNLIKDPKQDDDEFIKTFYKDAGVTPALPMSWVYDHSGKRQYFKMGRFDPAALEKLISDLIAHN
jgi:thiol-disulfide isomerase/thioredoxin